MIQKMNAIGDVFAPRASRGIHIDFPCMVDGSCFPSMIEAKNVNKAINNIERVGWVYQKWCMDIVHNPSGVNGIGEIYVKKECDRNYGNFFYRWGEMCDYFLYHWCGVSNKGRELFLIFLYIFWKT